MWNCSGFSTIHKVTRIDIHKLRTGTVRRCSADITEGAIAEVFMRSDPMIFIDNRDKMRHCRSRT